jgi:hypothetical protein
LPCRRIALHRLAGADHGAGHPHLAAGAIFAELLRLRPQAWPNLRLLEIGDALLGRDGTLVAGAAVLYRQQLQRRPELAEQFRACGRGREVELGSS